MPHTDTLRWSSEISKETLLELRDGDFHGAMLGRLDVDLPCDFEEECGYKTGISMATPWVYCDLLGDLDVPFTGAKDRKFDGDMLGLVNDDLLGDFQGDSVGAARWEVRWCGTLGLKNDDLLSDSDEDVVGAAIVLAQMTGRIGE